MTRGRAPELLAIHKTTYRIYVAVERAVNEKAVKCSDKRRSSEHDGAFYFPVVKVRNRGKSACRSLWGSIGLETVVGRESFKGNALKLRVSVLV